MANSKTIGKVTSGLITLIIAVYAIATLIISYYLYFAPRDALSAFILSGYLLILIPTFVIALIIALLLRKWWLILLLLPNLLIIVVFLLPYFTPKTPATYVEGQTIRVMTYNVRNRARDESRNTIAQLVESVNPDIVAFQEFADFAHFRWQESGQMAYPYNARGMTDNAELSGQGVYTRFPILDEEVWVYEDLSPEHPHQRLLLDIHGTQVVLYNIHPYPPIEWGGRFSFAVNQADIYAHTEAMNRLIARISAETLPVIVLGDMNMSDQFPAYQSLASILTDSFIEAGYGFGFTYPASSRLPELIRLDYIFHSAQFRTVNAVVLPDTDTSDHLPVVADLVMGN